MSSPQGKQDGTGNAPPDADNNLGRGAPADREERIRQRAHDIWEQEGRPEGRAEDHWDRAAQDLDREDGAIRRDGTGGERAGAKTGSESERKQRTPDKA